MKRSSIWLDKDDFKAQYQIFGVAGKFFGSELLPERETVPIIQIVRDLSVNMEMMMLHKAAVKGAISLFGAKHEDVVRVYLIFVRSIRAVPA
jgi:hypothetical protein